MLQTTVPVTVGNYMGTRLSNKNKRDRTESTENTQKQPEPAENSLPCGEADLEYLDKFTSSRKKTKLDDQWAGVVREKATRRTSLLLDFLAPLLWVPFQYMFHLSLVWAF